MTPVRITVHLYRNKLLKLFSSITCPTTKEVKIAKYTGSPFGSISGKVSGAVGSVWKGIKYMKEHTIPKQKGTIAKYDANADGCARGIDFSHSQMNYRRCILGLLGFLGRQTYENLMKPVWQELCDKKNWKMTGANHFIQVNARILWKSFPHKDTEFSATNFPDMRNMQVSDGDLEAAPRIISAVKGLAGPPYNVQITWDTLTYLNGKPGDVAWLAIYKKPSTIEFTKRVPRGALYVKNTGQARSTGSAAIVVPSSVHTDLTAFAFFSDACANYSPSVSSSVVIL